jgi:hypothetical protein
MFFPYVSIHLNEVTKTIYYKQWFVKKEIWIFRLYVIFMAANEI